MKTKILTLGCILSCILSYCQDSPFGILTDSKFAIEFTISRLHYEQSPSSKKYKDLLPEYRKIYKDVVGSYQGFRGNLVTCVLSKKKEDEFTACTNNSSKKLLKSLENLEKFDNTMSIKLQEKEPIDSTKIDPHRDTDKDGIPDRDVPLKFVGVDPLESVIKGLFSGGIEIWNNAVNLKNQKRKEYTDNINNEVYNIEKFEKLLPSPTKKD